ncbi:type I 3-dehydroquinate dehydratase [Cellulomonas marina]|uniref:3-dehydroquinate dehydratase n=1 Tax=Cellulomonas marina TaxID=988821 RepID=A0A1I0W8W0_9CELL|nr:type I 3-dehydroquinate dehydratase [Cellulomonas marina]GIG29121.1 3-dehydroquinate dehydratase [Cellulomonas marina]SFA84728.1 3-dehydroquinate dehydratase [Cellulomonas marina]
MSTVPSPATPTGAPSAAPPLTPSGTSSVTPSVTSSGESDAPRVRVVRVGTVELGAGRPKVVVPLTAADTAGLVEEARAARGAHPDLVEWRVDHLRAGLAPREVVAAGRALVAALEGLPLLVTVRTAAEGGAADPDDTTWAAALEAAVAEGLADAVDVEGARGADAVARVVAAARHAGVPVVASRHEVRSTPPQDVLTERLLALGATGADVLKIAVMPQAPEDVLALLGATRAASLRTDRPLVTMAMGPLGVLTRLGGGVFGSCATFGRVGRASAPGQVAVAPLRAALAVVHGADDEGVVAGADHAPGRAR